MDKLKYTALTILLVTTINIRSQSNGQNYIVTQVYTSPTTHLDRIQYYDGLGRPNETVQKQFTPSGKDLFSRIEYDNFGRESKVWLPVPNNRTDGSYSGSISTHTVYGSDANAYSETYYEPSPLNRVDRQYGPGAAWRNGNGHKVTTEYLSNKLPSVDSTLACPYYYHNDIYSFGRNGYYAAGTLYVSKITNEDEQVSYEFKDKQGRVILQRNRVNGQHYDTQYIYDDFGNLAIVVPPVLANQFTANRVYGFFDNDVNPLLNQYMYLYYYDHRNLIIGKKRAGINTEDYAYDKGRRLIMELTPEREMIFHKYDALGRMILSGIYHYPGPENNMYHVQNYYANYVLTENPSPTGAYNYTWNCFPAASEVEVMRVNYYDDYTYATGGLSLLIYQAKTGYGVQHSSAKGLLTGVRTKLLDGSGEIITAYYYDTKGNLIQTRSTNHMGGYDLAYYAYNYNNLMTRKYTEQTLAGQSTAVTEEYAYNYSSSLRLTSVTHKLNGGSEITLASYQYNDLGQVSQKITGGTETATLSYNLRGWLNAQSGNRFSENLYYTSNPQSGGLSYYGGNIAALTWKSSPNTSTVRGYSFQYNAANWLTHAQYGEGTALNSNTQRYSEYFSYDNMGRMQTLQRQGLKDNNTYGAIDDLQITYNGFCLREVNDLAGDQSHNDVMEFKDGINNPPGEYVHDCSARIMSDYNRKVCMIRYNYLSLPQSVQFRYGHRIEYVYDASGMKHRTRHREANHNLNLMPWDTIVPKESDILLTTITDYVGNKIYRNGQLQMILTEEGYIEKNGSSYTYYYYLKDHLGNNRIVMNSSGTVVQVNNYYPSGTSMAERRTDQGIQPYKYNGKELDRSYSLDLYDYDARMFDPVMMRFMRPDPLSEKYYWITPYAYCLNNPVNYTDPDGRFPVWAVVGAALDYGLQVYDNYQKGNTGYDAWIGNVDFVDVALSAVNPVGKFAVVKTLAVEATKSAIDVSFNEGVKVKTDVQKIATDAVVNTAVSTGAGKLTNASSTKAVQNANKEAAAANKQLKTAERQAERSPNSTKKAENVSTAKSNAQAARNKEVTTKILNSTVGKVPAEAVQQATTGATERIRREDEKK